MQGLCSPKTPEPVHDGRIPEARYSYYRRCHVFRRNGVQCKAPAETGAQICHAHAGQLAIAVRRERERRAVLAEAVAEMPRRGRPECEMADLFTDFKGIQVTLAVVSRTLIIGKIECKTAGHMLVQLQTMSKLLWVYHIDHRGTQREKAINTKHTKKHEGLPHICADERRLKTKSLPLCVDEGRLSKLKEMMPLLIAAPRNVYRERAPDCGDSSFLSFEVSAFGDRCRAHGPPELKAA